MNNLPDDSHNKSEIILYQTEDGKSRIEVKLHDETVWLSQKLMAELFQKDVRTINEHIKNTYAEGELRPDSTIRKFRIVQVEGKRQVTREVDFFNLDVIIYEKFRMAHLNAPSAVERHFAEAVKEVKRLEKEVKPQKTRKKNLKT